MQQNTLEATTAELSMRQGTATIADVPATSQMQTGKLILNADDWGRDRETTDKTLVCHQGRALSSVSAMMFMEDSERSAALAREHNVDAGLHLNLTTAFTAKGAPARVAEQQGKITRYLRWNKLAPVIFHPGLANAFAHVVNAQIEEFVRLYGATPARIDGHHHMHLCANVLNQELLPAGTTVRRNFSFRTGEKSWANRKYREIQDRRLAERHRMTEFFFSLPPLEPARVQRIFAMAQTSTVEVETHPVVDAEFQFLSNGTIFNWTNGIAIEPAYRLNTTSGERQ